eukprot:Gb_24534 [translate_table: standard]
MSSLEFNMPQAFHRVQGSMVWAGLASIFILYWVFSKLNEKGKRNRGKLPPGPSPWPIIGNLHLLGELPHRSLGDLAKKYGSIMFLRLGFVPTVVVSSPQMAELFLKTHDAVFASRPLTAAGKHVSYNNQDVVFAPYGAYWRHMRKVCTLELLTVKRLESFKSVREEEVSLMIDSIWKESGHGVKPVDLSKRISSLTLNIMCRMLTGKTYSNYDSEGREFNNMFHEIAAVDGAFNIGDFIPFLNWLDLQGLIRRMKKVFNIYDAFAEKVIDEHIERRKEKGLTSNDFVDALLDISETRTMEITRENIKAIILDMMAAGSDTSSTTLGWAMSELLKNPHVMKKAQEELESVVGKSRRVNESDLPRLEYLPCVVKEILRLYPAAPLMLPHEAMEACNVGGYDIPAKARLIVNVWAIGRDPSAWEDPLTFKPERFIGRNIDPSRGQYFELLPFGAGRRGCPGGPLAIGVLEMALAQLLHCFDWSLEFDPSTLDMSEGFGITIPRKVHLYALPKPRLDMNRL